MTRASAVIVGASSGYGLGIARVLLNRGWSVTCLARRTCPDARARSLPCDVTHPGAVTDAVAAVGRVDLAVYSAGIAVGLSNVEQGSSSAWARVFSVNVMGLMATLRATLPRLRETKGTFVHIGSIASELNYAGGADYCASKAAARSVMRTVRREVLGSGVRTVSVEPGLGATDFQLNRYNGDAELAARHHDGVRQLDPQDLGDLVAWITEQPAHVNLDEVVIKPLDQATHGLVHRSLAK